jgi:ATP-dependent Clp endopeptidase proteolytic subunit ClpP
MKRCWKYDSDDSDDDISTYSQFKRITKKQRLKKEYQPYSLPDMEWMVEMKKRKNGYSGSSKVSTKGRIITFSGKVCRESSNDLCKAIAKLNAEWEMLLSEELIKKATPNPIILKINSNGGTITSAFRVIDAMKSSKVPIHTIVEGCAASAATLISICGSKRFITKRAYMLIHQLSSGVIGKHAEMEDELKNCNLMMEDIRNLYKEHTNMKKKIMKKFLLRDLLWKADECLKHGLVDEIIQDN